MILGSSVDSSILMPFIEMKDIDQDAPLDLIQLRAAG